VSGPGAASGASGAPAGWPDWPEGVPALAESVAVEGGWVCVSLLGRLVDGTEVVVKRCPYPAELEADGLLALARAGVPVPAVIGHSASLLVLERVGGPPDWAGLGRAVARMHQVTGPRFGWHQDNSGGLTTQRNGWADDWPTFFVERRVLAHLHDPSIPEPLAERLRRACAGPLPELLPQRPPASLTHGDLWSGNVVGGRWLIDPAVSYADRELDLVFMQMSGTLPSEFFAAYLDELPLDPGYEHRRDALRLHKLLNGLRHFGPGHVPRVEAVLDHYGW
jgi:fructosamine-3-kinase